VRRPTFSPERKLWKEGYKLVAGIDEVGRGSWAGPVTAAAVIFPSSVRLGVKLNDSKRLAPHIREELAEVIKRKALFWAVGSADHFLVDERGIKEASELAIAEAIDGIHRKPEFLLVDFFNLSFWPEEYQNPLKFGDQLSNSIAAASILAKVARDEFMREQEEVYPDYGFAQHKGYGTRQHREAIEELGICEIHRKSFVPKG